MRLKTLCGLAVATVLFSLVGILVKLIQVPSAGIALSRGLIACVTLLAFLALRRRPLFVLHRPADLLPLCLLGAFMGGNWFFFFVSIKVSTVSVAVISLFCYPLITALVEPIVLRTRHNLVDCAGAAVVIAGVALVVPSFRVTDTTTLGVLYGLLSAVSITLCNITNKKLVTRYSPMDMLTYQFLGAAVLFLPALPSLLKPVPALDVAYLVLLGAVLTTFSMFLFINSFRFLAASTASILASMQPFLTVVLAVVLLKEAPAAKTLLGGALICGTVVAVSLVHALRPAGEGSRPA